MVPATLIVTALAAGQRRGCSRLAFSVTPLGVGEGVAEAVRVVRASGLPNQTDSMFTTIEGDWVGIQLTTLGNRVSAGSRCGIQALAAAMASEHISSIVATCALSAAAWMWVLMSFRSPWNPPAPPPRPRCVRVICAI
jgi:Thiamine-binding protein